MADLKRRADNGGMSFEGKLLSGFNMMLFALLIFRVFRNPLVLYGLVGTVALVLIVVAWQNRRRHGWTWPRPSRWRIAAAWGALAYGVVFAVFLFAVGQPSGTRPWEQQGLAEVLRESFEVIQRVATNPGQAPLLLFLVTIVVTQILTVLQAISMTQEHFDRCCSPPAADEHPGRPSSVPAHVVEPVGTPGLFGQIAIVGFLVTLVVHLTEWVSPGSIPPGVVFPLFVGIFVVWIPTVFALRKSPVQDGGVEGLARVARSVPRWMVVVAVLAFVWAVPNFMIGAGSDATNPARMMSGHALPFYAIAMVVQTAKSKWQTW